MMKTYSLTTEEMIIVLLELEQIAAAKSLIESLEDLGTEVNLTTTLKVATRSLVSKGVMEVVEDEYVFEPMFKDVIETYLQAEKTMRVSKVYNNAELVILVYKSQVDLYITHSMKEFVFNFNVYVNEAQLLADIVAFSDIPEGEQLIETPHIIKQDIPTLLTETEPTMYEQALLQNDVPAQFVAAVLEDHANMDIAHAYVIINEALEVVKPALIVQANKRSWISYEVDERIEMESFTAEKLKYYLEENFFNEEN